VTDIAAVLIGLEGLGAKDRALARRLTEAVRLAERRRA